jgi:predicted DNA-binding transcriptional regulator AlpA
MTTEDDRYLTEDEFCARYHLAPRTAQRWRITGCGPKWVRIGPRRIGYRLSDCEVWTASRTFAHRADELARGAEK